MSRSERLQQLRLVLVELEIMPLATAVHLRDATRKIHDGVYQADPREDKRFGVMFDEWWWWASALKAARASA